ncbi:MAG: methylmalonyl Co-A mutase-associated GTPase MeaB [Anaerolineae bacterium]
MRLCLPMPEESQKPEWAPPQAGQEFASRVIKGVEGRHDGLRSETRLDEPAPQPDQLVIRRRQLSLDDYVQGVLAGDRTILGRAITLIESNAPAHMELAQEVLKQLLPHTGRSIRVGITGVPGVGKSTFIEALGMHLCEQGHRLAVLAVDPSSSVSRGSILGDKTRMERLSREPKAFIRPSPSSGTLGGVTRKSRETMLVCEAAGFDVILVETVGVGQSETTVRSMVDFFLLLMLAGAGDELQGIKRGIIELADALIVNKADGENKVRAQAARAEYARALRFLSSTTEGWHVQAFTCSALTGEGIAEIWAVIEAFRETTTASGVFAARRQAQILDWMQAMIEEHLKTLFFNHTGVKRIRPQIEQSVLAGTLPATVAVKMLLEKFEGDKGSENSNQ